MKCGHCKSHHDTVAEVRECAGMPARESRHLAPPEPKRSVADLTEGMWLLPDHKVQNSPAVYKIQVAHHGSGKLYAKALNYEEDGRGTFAYAPGAMKLIARSGRKMTLEEAKAFGKLYGFCCRCGAVLTDERSIENGIGPYCAGKLS